MNTTKGLRIVQDQTDGSGPDPDVVADIRRHGMLASAEALPALRAELETWARAVGLSDRIAAVMALAAYEAMANSVEHAYRDAPGVLDLEAAYYGHGIEVTVTDYGSWITPQEADQQRRRGLPLIHMLADEAIVRPTKTGTQVQMRWSIETTGNGT